MDKLPKNLQKTLDLIPTTAECAISRKKLAFKRGQEDRTNRENIHELRRLGYPICVADSGGYYLSQDPLEILKTVADYRARGRECLKIANRLEQIARRLRQGEMF